MVLPTSISLACSKHEALRLYGNWQVQPVSLEAAFSPEDLTLNWIDVPDCTHLQRVLYPDRPYWGDHLRTINQRAWVYQRTFKTPTTPYQRARLRFDGVDYFAEVWVNGAFVGRHEGHFTPFELDVTPFLSGEEVTLTVRVSSPWDAPNPSGTYPSDHVIRGLVKGHYEHGEGVIPPNVNPLGIWRPVWLLLDQGVSIDHVLIRTELTGQVDLQFRLTNSTPNDWRGTLVLEIEADNHNGSGVKLRCPLTVPPGGQTVNYTLHIPDVHLWWSWDQGAPDLYHLEALLLDSDDEINQPAKQERFGVRTVRLERSASRFVYWLNDRPVFIRGTSYMSALYLSDCDEVTLERDLTVALEANLNLLRVHVHVAPPELYDLCDSAGMLVWQDFELNWIQECSAEFERRARALQHAMIEMLQNHPSIMTWACHNEPTMIFMRRHNLEHQPDPALYADAQRQDPTRPVFICSGQLEDDWRRAGDSHTYFGAIWSSDYTDIYRHRSRLHTEFGFEAPAALDTLRASPEVWDRLKHLEGHIEALGAYQAALIQYHVEHLRRLRSECCAGYIHFWLVDLVPQVGCGVLDVCRIPKGGYDALRRASQPIQVALEHDGRRPVALWIFNDTVATHHDTIVHWQITSSDGHALLDGETHYDITANASQRVKTMQWSTVDCARITLSVTTANGELLCENEYAHPFQAPRRPRGYPWKFDPYLGTKVFDRLDAPSLADQNAGPLVNWVPLRLREFLAERLLRQRLPTRLLTWIAWLGDRLVG